MIAKTVLLLAAVVPAFAQSSWWPPRILQIEREEVQPGKMPQYETLSAAYADALGRARVTIHRIALNMVVGGDRERVYITGYESMDAVERARDDWGQGPLRVELETLREKISEILADRQTMVAVYRPELSYRPTDFNYSEIRYVLMNQHIVAASQEAQYAQDIKGQMNTLAKADVNRHWYVFRTLVGAPTGTAILVEPFRALREVDPFIDSFASPFNTTYLSSRSPEIGIFMVSRRASYPK